MDKVTFADMPNIKGDLITYAIIDRGNGEFTSMLKSTYDQMIAQSEAASL